MLKPLIAALAIPAALATSLAIAPAALAAPPPDRLPPGYHKVCYPPRYKEVWVPRYREVWNPRLERYVRVFAGYEHEWVLVSPGHCVIVRQPVPRHY